jgi:hypothetical protein
VSLDKLESFGASVSLRLATEFIGHFERVSHRSLAVVNVSVVVAVGGGCRGRVHGSGCCVAIITSPRSRPWSLSLSPSTSCLLLQTCSRVAGLPRAGGLGAHLDVLVSDLDADARMCEAYVIFLDSIGASLARGGRTSALHLYMSVLRLLCR